MSELIKPLQKGFAPGLTHAKCVKAAALTSPADFDKECS